MTHRRTVLTGLGALGLIGCAPQGEGTQPAQQASRALDLSALEARYGGRLGFAALDTGTGRRLAARGDERFVYCSTFKTFLAAATLMRVEAGEEHLDRAIPVTPADMVSHAPVTGPATGRSLTVEELMRGTVEVSDNPAANLLLRAMGGLKPMQDFYRGIGDAPTRVDRFEPEMNRLDGDRDTTTPLQSVANLQRLFMDPASPLSAASQSMLLDWMLVTPTGPGRLKAGVPTDWRVAHKTGTGGYGPTNDIGILYPPTGAPVVVAAYFHATPDSAAEANEAAIAEATRMTLTALGRA